MTLDPFVVHVASLLGARGRRRQESRRGVFDPRGEVRPGSPVDSRVPEGADASCEVVLESYDGGVMATGRVRAPWVGVCRRCTTPVGGELEVAVKERFVETDARPATTGSRRGPGVPGDEDAYAIVADRLDLGPLVREAVVLELPLAPLCREDCRGLCPYCGIDRNEERCDCVAPRDPRWASLDVLRLPS